MKSNLKTKLLNNEIYTIEENIRIAFIKSNGADFYLTGNAEGSDPIPIDGLILENTDFMMNGLIIDARNTTVSLAYTQLYFNN